MEFLAGLYRKLRSYCEQLYTPKELRALSFFLLLGIAMLCVRAGTGLYRSYFPSPDAERNRVEIAKRDSLFTAISLAADRHDSLFFSLPPDTSSVSHSHSRSAKGKNLAPSSIALNSASEEQLMLLPNIGPKYANGILDYRRLHGKFRSFDELRNVKGIGQKRLEKIRPFLRLD